MNSEIIKKSIKKAIKQNELHIVKQLMEDSSSHHLSHRDFLEKCIRLNRIDIFNYILNKKGYICYHVLMYSLKHEVFVDAILEFLEKHPEHSHLDMVYANILAWYVKRNHNKEKIEYLVTRESLGFENRIKDNIFLRVFLRESLKNRSTNLNNVIDFFVPYLVNGIIKKEEFICVLSTLWYKRHSVNINQKNKKIFIGIDLDYNFKIYKYYSYIFYYPTDGNNLQVNTIEQINQMNEVVVELPVGALLKLNERSIFEINGESVEYVIDEDLKKKIDTYCIQHRVKNIGEPVEDYLKRFFEHPMYTL